MIVGVGVETLSAVSNQSPSNQKFGTATHRARSASAAGAVARAGAGGAVTVTIRQPQAHTSRLDIMVLPLDRKECIDAAESVPKYGWWLAG